MSVTNGNDEPVQVRLAYLVWEKDEKNVPQQFVAATPVGGLITVPANGSAGTPVDFTTVPNFYQDGDYAPATILPYYSH